MNMSKALFYDPTRTFEDNLLNGPFDDDGRDIRESAEPSYTFLGRKLASPFGIAAGSLPTSRHTDLAFRLGYDMVCYKTQRSDIFPCNPFPNVVGLKLDGDLTLEKMQQPQVGTTEYATDLSKLTITNSFGVPSRAPDVWTRDLKKAIRGAGKGQMLIMSVVGTIKDGAKAEEYYDDFANTAKLAKDAGVEAVEVNLSCPNVASEGVICYTREAVREICQRTKAAIGQTPLIIKVGYYTPDQQTLLEAILDDVQGYIGAVSAINTLPASVVDENGEQYLPGKGRLKSGTCGAGIKWAGLDMVRRLDSLRKTKGYAYEIIGVGGVMNPVDFQEYRAAGADVVQSVTGAMWNPALASEIKQSLK
jgi:dihydroorotate dehydrogenase